MEEGTHKSSMEPPQGKRGGRKRKKSRRPFMCRSHTSSIGVTESCHMNWCDLCMSHAKHSGVTESIWHDRSHREQQSRQCTWCDSFINHARRTDVTKKDQI
jgi:hypothetical protein